MSPGSPGRPSRRSDGYAAGQVLAMSVILLLSLPVLPLLLLLVAWVRLRDRAGRHKDRQPAIAPRIEGIRL